MPVDERLERAKLLYERVVFGGNASALAPAEQDLDAVEADLNVARGRVLHARFLEERHEDPHELALFQRAAEIYQRLDDVRGEGEALFWVGTFHQVVRNDDDSALPALERSRALATRAGDTLTLSYALRHLAIVEHNAGRLETARQGLEESTRLRRELGFMPGVTANLVGLTYISAAQGRRDDALALLAEAGAIAAASGAHAIIRQIEEAQTQM